MRWGATWGLCAAGKGEGKLRPVARSEGGHRRYARANIPARLGQRLGIDKTAAIHARLRTRKQAEAGNPERQRLMEHVAVSGYAVVRDGARGLSARRRDLRRMVEAAERHALRLLSVEHSDRLARFGYPYLDVLGAPIVTRSHHDAEHAQVEPA